MFNPGLKMIFLSEVVCLCFRIRMEIGFASCWRYNLVSEPCKKKQALQFVAFIRSE